MVRRDGSAPSASSVSVRRSAIDLPAHGAAPRIRTGTVHALNVMPLLVGLVRREWLPRIDLHDDDLGQSQAGCCYLTGQEMEPAAGNAPAEAAEGNSSGRRTGEPSSAVQERRDSLSIHAGEKVAEAGGHAPHSTQWNDLFSRQSRRACPVQLPKMVSRHGAAPCSVV